MNEQPEIADTLVKAGDHQSSDVILNALSDAERAFRDYNEICRRIDNIYSARGTLTTTAQDLGLTDQEYDLFWSSMEVLKPAIYAKPPQVVAKPRFSDATSTDKVVAELIERVVNSEFERAGVDMQLREVRDDMALLNRGVLRVSLEDGAICIDHMDRLDYRHEPVRYWRELGWEAFGAWLTEREMKKRFPKARVEKADYVSRTSRSDDDGNTDESMKCLVWEVWSKVDNKVYWVTEGVPEILDQSEPYIALRDFWPGPRPAYGTLRRRSLIPVPDYVRYERLLNQINDLTAKIYALIGEVRMLGLVAGGGDVAQAVQALLNSNDSMTIVPVSGAALMASGGASNLVQWLPLVELAQAIQGLLESRAQFFADFDRLSGISDIMRGETEANETLGAQRIKTQYGSVRVKDKTDEIVRLARDTARIAVEIVCTNYSRDKLLEIAQMDIPTRGQVDKEVAALKKAAESELKTLQAQVKDAIDQAQQSGQQIDPQAAQQQLKQAQAQLAEKYAPEFQRLANTVVIEDVMKVIKDRKERALVIDIETDSTVMVDEIAEKQMRNELLTAFSGAISSLQPLFMLGEAGVKIAVEILDFTMQPYVRNNRNLRAQFDELVENAPEIAARMAAAEGGGDAEGLVEAQKALAEAENKKADAAMAQVQARAALDKAEMQRKMTEMQQRAMEAAEKAQQDRAKLELQLADMAEKHAQSARALEAKIDLDRANVLKILSDIGLAQKQQQMDEFKSVADIELAQGDQQLAAQGQRTDAEFRGAEHERAEREQDFNEQSSDRQMSLAERQAEREADGD